jgi:hypothetical protein
VTCCWVTLQLAGGGRGRGCQLVSGGLARAGQMRLLAGGRVLNGVDVSFKHIKSCSRPCKPLKTAVPCLLDR